MTLLTARRPVVLAAVALAATLLIGGVPAVAPTAAAAADGDLTLVSNAGSDLPPARAGPRRSPARLERGLRRPARTRERPRDGQHRGPQQPPRDEDATVLRRPRVPRGSAVDDRVHGPRRSRATRSGRAPHGDVPPPADRPGVAAVRWATRPVAAPFRPPGSR